MLANGIKQTTTTTGTGNLTLSPVSGFPTFADAFAVNQPFSYGLIDSSGQPIEFGIGYLSNSSTLVRARVTATYSGGTYTQVSASVVSLSGTTTAICTPHAATVEAMPANVDNVSGSIGRYLTSAGRTSAFVTTAPSTINRLYYTPFVLRTGVVVSSLAINVATAQASCIAKAGIYACSADGYPGTLLVSAGNFDCSTTGFKALSTSASVFLPAGVYFTASVAQVAASNPNFTTYNNAVGNITGGSPFGFGASGTVINDSRYETLAGGASLPSAASSGTTNITTSPVVFVGAA